MSHFWYKLCVVVVYGFLVTKGENTERIQLKSIRESKTCLFAHNYIRKEWHGTDELEWDDDLAYEAENWAMQQAIINQKEFHSTMIDENGEHYGENLYYIEGSTSVQCMDAVYFWYMERQKCDSPSDCVTVRQEYDFENITYSEQAGHMQQLLWKTTKKVGVGIVTAHNNAWIVARYKPAGNSQTTNLKDFIAKPVKMGYPKENELVSSYNILPFNYTLEIKVSEICVDEVDEWDNCQNFLDECNSISIQSKCRKSCGVAQTQCTTKQEDEWTQWVKVSECSNICKYTEERFCINISKRDGGKSCVGERQRLQSCTGCECVDVANDCANQKAKGACELAEDWAKIQCRKTCGFCDVLAPHEEL